VSACGTARIAAAALVTGVAIAGCGGSVRVTAGRVTVERIALQASACAPGWRAPGGGRYRFEIVDGASRTASVTLQQALSGILLGRIPAAAPGSRHPLTARLAPGGAYRWSCTVAGTPARYSAAVQVPSQATTAPAARTPAPPATVDLIRPLGLYTVYVERRLGTLRGQLRTLRAQIAAGSLAGARTAWLTAHLTWLELGQDDGAYGAFGNLGGRIDGTTAGIAGRSTNHRFTGFHRVEVDLFRKRDLPAAGRDAGTLARLLGALSTRVLTADLPATTVGIDGWVLRCHEILEDALRDSLSGDDDYGSNSDLASLRADVSATREMLRVLAPLIEPRRPALVPTVTRQLASIDAAVSADGGHATAIQALPLRIRQRLDAATGAALETLAPVSELMQVGNT
jgi:high-affinity iron transporter